MNVRFHTLGCKLNFAETSTFRRGLLEAGFTETDGPADLVVVNTCSVTADADKKCRNMIRRLIQANPGAVCIVTGCYASLSKAEIGKIPGVSLVLTNAEKNSLVESAVALCRGLAPEPYEGYFDAFSSGDRTRSFLKVQDGCSCRCSYCTIPAARGASRNIPIDRIVSDAERIAALGQKEIVLTGVNIGDFGRTTGESFADLLKALDRVGGIERYRISSIEPDLLTDEVIDITSSCAKFMPHFHVPLQSGSNPVLRAMHRRYTAEKFADRILKVRERMPDTFFGIDVIVGFPTETEENFLETRDFLSALHPSFLHVFPFSSRPGTPAAGMPQVPFREKECRVHALTSLSGSLHRKFISSFLGQSRPVLWESVSPDGIMTGYTDNYIKALAPGSQSLVGRITQAALGSLSSDGQSVSASALS